MSPDKSDTVTLVSNWIPFEEPVMPGHGKTVMAAYLAGKQGTPRDAVIVGATVTITHTAGVMALGLALTLSASLAGDAVLGWLGVVSGALVAALGGGLLFNTIRGRRSSGHGHHHHHHHHAEDHHHEHDGHAHHDHDDQPIHVSRRGLVAMGFAGGLVPSSSALVVLLAAIALGRTLFGVVLVLGYGVGMALTLTLAGLLLVKVRDRLAARPQRSGGRLPWLGRAWISALPAVTAVMVIVVGLGLAGRSFGAIA